MTSTAVAATTRRYVTLNPATGELLHEYPTASHTEAAALLDRADVAYRAWREVPLDRRIALFGTVADLIDASAEELARQVSTEMGKPLAEATGEVGIASAIFRYYAANAAELLADETIEVAGYSSAVVRREPIGVVLGIEPWNGPLYQSMRVAAPNLMLGNTVLLKPAEICAGSTLMLERLFVEAGFPADVFTTALVSVEQVSTWIADPRLRAVTLTGSDRAGSAVGEQAGRHIKPVVLELGGSDPFIVLGSADVTGAIAQAAFCRLFNGGQICISPKRIIVVDSVADEFIAGLSQAVAAQSWGDPLDPQTTLGPLSSEAAAETLQAQYDDAVSKGATVVVPGGRVDGPGFFFKPAMLTDITPDMRLWSEEAFGPLVMVYRVADTDAAVELANGTPYGLGGSVFGAPEEAQAVARRIESGIVGINAWAAAPIEIPFGGTKRSGVGRELGRSGMDSFANVKSYVSL